VNKNHTGDDYHDLVTCEDDELEGLGCTGVYNLNVGSDKVLDFGNRLAKIATTFIGLEPEETEGAIGDALNVVGILLRVDQICTRVISTGGATFFTPFQWNALGVHTPSESTGIYQVSSFPWLMERIAGRDTVMIDTLENMPQEASETRRLLESLGVVSAMIVPLVWRSVVVGFLCVESLSIVHHWTANEKVWLEVLASIIAGALGHRETEMALRSAQEKLAASNAALEERVRERTYSLEKSLADLKEAQKVIIQQEKLSSIGQLAAGIAHEINNPTGFIMSNLHIFRDYYDSLTSIVSEYDLLHRVGSPDAIRTREALTRIEELKQSIDFDFMIKDAPNLLEESLAGTDRIKGIVLALQNFVRSSGNDRQPVMLEELLDRALKLAGNELKYKYTILKDYGKVPMTLACENQIERRIRRSASAFGTPGWGSRPRTCRKLWTRFLPPSLWGKELVWGCLSCTEYSTIMMVDSM